jgi:hypothetical protein
MRHIVEFKTCVKRVPEFKAIQYVEADFKELLIHGVIDGMNVHGAYIETETSGRRHVEDGMYIVFSFGFPGERKVMSKESFEEQYEIK